MNQFHINQNFPIHAARRPLFQILVLAISAFAVSHTYAGMLFYNAIPPTDSDANSGISTANQYTSAVDGGNTLGTDRVVNGITLYALSANGQTSTADNCTVTALAGTLTNAGGSIASIQADGTLKEVLASMTFNNDAGDNSEQEIVLDPSSLEAGTTYDLRVYISKASGQNRQVNLAFVGDGQAPVETGFFNEEDATTSAGGFTDPSQAYYINYRYTWDGESTPGITITQKSGTVPFCLYALTNQVVSSGAAAEPAAAEEGGLSAGFVNTESDQVGVASDDFYKSESLNKHGRWVKIDKWGASWQPENVSSGWSPYTNGSFQYCDDCGWTFVSDEPWAWATYHYGRWARVHSGCGWAWIPGRVWAGSWVSWRSGGDTIGWAPLPPEAGCELDVGISTWADREYDIGPDYYTFINIRDFGADSYFRGGFIYNRVRNVTIINQTINITNIAYNRRITFAGGPSFFSLNQQIQRSGGRGIPVVNANRFANDSRFPRIRGGVGAHTPKFAETLRADKIDKGWGSVKDPKIKDDLRKRMAEQSRGMNPKNTRGTLPPNVAQNVLKKHGGPQQSGGPLNQYPSPKGGNQKGQGGPVAQGGQGQHPGGTFDQHPSRKHGNEQGQGGPVAQGGQGQHPGSTFDQHPGPKRGNQQGKTDQPGSAPVAQGGEGPKGNPKKQNLPDSEGSGPVARNRDGGGPKGNPKKQNLPGSEGSGPVAKNGGGGNGPRGNPRKQNLPGSGASGPVAHNLGGGDGVPRVNPQKQNLPSSGGLGPIAHNPGGGNGVPRANPQKQNLPNSGGSRPVAHNPMRGGWGRPSGFASIRRGR